MAASLTPQSAQVPFGYAMVSGQKVPVMIAPEWFRFIAVDLFNRAGKFNALTNTELEGIANATADSAQRVDSLAALVASAVTQASVIQAGEMIMQPGVGQCEFADVYQVASADVLAYETTSQL